MEKKIKNVVLVVLGIVLLCAFSVLAFGGGPERFVRDDYTKEARVAETVIIRDYVNLRSEPIVLDDKTDGATNSYGTKTIKAAFTMPVTKVYDEYVVTKSRPLDYANGFFLGILVSDIQNVENWEEIFPKSIVDDPDGIVWINCDYITVK